MKISRELKKTSNIVLIIIGLIAISISVSTIFASGITVLTRIKLNIISQSLMVVFFIILGFKDIKSKDKQTKTMGVIFFICAALTVFFIIKVIGFI